jgi:hypothetical protein
MFGARLNKLGAPSKQAPFAPTRLFADSEGFYNDIQTYSTSYFTDTAGTDPAELEDTIGLVLDQSGNDIDFTQATAGARPKLSARYNLLERTEEFDNAYWSKLNLLPFGAGSVANTTATLDPLGGNTAELLVANTTLSTHGVFRAYTYAAGAYQSTVYAKAAGYDGLHMTVVNAIATSSAGFDLTAGTIKANHSNVEASIESVGDGWFRCSVSATGGGGAENVRYYFGDASTIQGTIDGASGSTGAIPPYVGDGTSGIYIWGADLRLASDSDLPYQKVVTATDYDSEGFDPYLQFDQVDDALVATIPAITGGTLVLATRQGIWIDDDINASAGTFSIGPTTYTGGPADLFDDTGGRLIGPPVLLDRQLTSAERTSLIQWFVGRGAGNSVTFIKLLFDRAGSSILDRNDDPIRVRAA